MMDLRVWRYVAVETMGMLSYHYEGHRQERGEVPFLQGYLRLEKQVDQLSTQVREKRKEIDSEQTAVGLKMADRLGMVVGVTRKLPGTAVGYGSYFPNGKKTARFMEGLETTSWW